MQEDKTVALGVTLEEGGFHFVGVEDLNNDLAHGWRVISIGPGSVAVVPERQSPDGEESFSLIGWTIPVVLSR